MRKLWSPVSARPGIGFAPPPDDDGRRRPPFSPLSFSHLEEYYNSIGTGYGNGANVDPWVDLSGHSPTRDMQGITGIATVPPTMLSSSSPNGADQVSFNGTNSALTTGTINPFPTGARGHSFFIGGDFRATTAPPAAFAGALLWVTSLFNSCPKEILYQTVGGLDIAWRDSGGFHGNVNSPIGTHNLAFIFDINTGNGDIYVDGVSIFTAAFTFGGNAADTTSLSDAINNNVPLNADLGYFAWYSDSYPQLVAPFQAWGNALWGY